MTRTLSGWCIVALAFGLAPIGRSRQKSERLETYPLPVGLSSLEALMNELSSQGSVYSRSSASLPSCTGTAT